MTGRHEPYTGEPEPIDRNADGVQDDLEDDDDSA